MRSPFRGQMRDAHEFCDRCGSVGDGFRRSQILRDDAVRHAILYGQRF